MPSIRTNLIAVVLLGLASVAAAEAPEDIPRLRQFTQGAAARALVQNRRRTHNPRLQVESLGNFQIQSNLGSGQKETVSLGTDRGRPNLTYERTTLKEQLKITVAAAGGKASISRSPRGKSSFAAMEFQQAPDEKTTLTLGTGDHQQVFHAADLWRLAIAQPKECKEHLFPLLDLLRPEWKPAATVARIETSLLARANEDTMASHTRWAELVRQLGDDQFAKREAADRALRAGGTSALSYLRALDFDHLDAQQQFRIRRIMWTLGGRNDEDSAEQVAGLLVNDRLVWLALLGRPEAATRKTAARQLAKLLGQPIDVDPAAEPDTQKAKRDKLRLQIEKK